jgi:hypothetical protein
MFFTGAPGYKPRANDRHFTRSPSSWLVAEGCLQDDLNWLAARRGAGGIVSGNIAGVKRRALCGVRGFDEETYKREQTGSGLRPFGGCGAAAAMVLTAVAVISGLKRGFGGFGPGRLCHRMMAWHGRCCRLCGLAHAAAHGCRLSALRHRQRSEGRSEHDQQQKSSGPAGSPPHLRDSIAENRFSANRCH